MIFESKINDNYIDVKNYKEKLKGINVVEVSGESCANCSTLMPILQEITSKIDGVNLYHIEASPETEELIVKYDIHTVPTTMIMYNDECYVSCRGFQPEEILELWINTKINEIKKNKNI